MCIRDRCGAGCQLVVAAEFLCDQLLERLIVFFPRGVFNILKGQKNHRILSMVGKIGSSAGPDFLISEVNGSVLGRLLDVYKRQAQLPQLINVFGMQGRLGEVSETDHLCDQPVSYTHLCPKEKAPCAE